MSSRHAAWMRELDAKAPLVTIRCLRCDHTAEIKETQAGVWKMAHQHNFHYGHAESFSVKKKQEGSNALP